MNAHTKSLPTREELAHTANRISRAILTLSVLPDKEAGFIYGGQKAAWPEIVQEVRDAYGYSEAKRPKFRPTPRDVDDMLVVFEWLTWLKRQPDGEREFRILWSRAFGVPWWKLAERYDRGERTIQRWADGAISLVHRNLVQSAIVG